MVLALAVAGQHSGSFRYAIERMDPAEYLATSYYEHWMHAAETMLVEGGHLEPGEVDARLTSGPDRPSHHDAELTGKVRGLFRFDPVTREMELASVHPGVPIETVQAETGWPLRLADPVRETVPPRADELAMIRRFDPEGFWTRPRR